MKKVIFISLFFIATLPRASWACSEPELEACTIEYHPVQFKIEDLKSELSPDAIEILISTDHFGSDTLKITNKTRDSLYHLSRDGYLPIKFNDEVVNVVKYVKSKNYACLNDSDESDLNFDLGKPKLFKTR